MKKIFKKIKLEIKKANKIALFGHRSSDADCIGSLLSFYYILKRLNKAVDVYVEDISSDLKLLNKDDIIKTKLLNNDYDLLISVDVASSNQLGIFKDFFIKHNNTIVIDHHRGGENYSKIVLRNFNYPSNCDILIELFNYLKVKITPEVATCLYAGIMGDTGRLLHYDSLLIPYEHTVDLIKYGANVKLVNDMLYRNISKQTYKLKKKMFELAEIKKDYALCILTHDVLPKGNFTTDDFVNTMLHIEGVNISILCTEKIKGIFNVSIRSKNNFSALDIAKKFGGGGHFNAAGCSIKENKTNLKKMLIDAIKSALKGK